MKKKKVKKLVDDFLLLAKFAAYCDFDYSYRDLALDKAKRIKAKHRKVDWINNKADRLIEYLEADGS